MKWKQRRTRIIGALIFAALVAIVGFGLVATGNFRSPFDFLQGGQHQGGSGAAAFQATNNSAGRPALTFDHAGPQGGQGFAPDQAGPGGNPEGGNNSSIAWNQIGGVLSDLWILFAIVAGYILVQQILGLTINRFWARNNPQPTT
jgi:hypothetical protein